MFNKVGVFHQHRICGEQAERLEDGLCDQEPIERIAVQRPKLGHRRRMSRGHRKLAETAGFDPFHQQRQISLDLSQSPP